MTNFNHSDMTRISNSFSTYSNTTLSPTSRPTTAPVGLLTIGLNNLALVALIVILIVLSVTLCIHFIEPISTYKRWRKNRNKPVRADAMICDNYPENDEHNRRPTYVREMNTRPFSLRVGDHTDEPADERPYDYYPKLLPFATYINKGIAGLTGGTKTRTNSTYEENPLGRSTILLPVASSVQVSEEETKDDANTNNDNNSIIHIDEVPTSNPLLPTRVSTIIPPSDIQTRPNNSEHDDDVVSDMIYQISSLHRTGNDAHRSDSLTTGTGTYTSRERETETPNSIGFRHSNIMRFTEDMRGSGRGRDASNV